MTRNYKRRSSRKCYDDETILEAVKAVKAGKISLRKIAKKFGMTPTILSYHARKVKNRDLQDNDIQFLKKNSKHRQILSNNLEEKLVSYLLHAADIYIGLNSKNIRSLAYEFAVANNANTPPSWITNEMAGADWINSFFKRHPELSVRLSEAGTPPCVKNYFNKVVKQFFGNYERVMQRYKFQSMNIYNMDETKLTTDHKPNKVVRHQEEKQIGAITSCSKGEQVTLVATICAAGHSIPPFFIFPRVRFHKQKMLRCAPKGSAGTVHRSGWMNKDIFLQYMEHFLKYSRCSIKKPCLLILDNRPSYISLDSIKFAKENGIILLTLSPHCSHRLQPLGRTVFDLLKAAKDKACSKWMSTNPGKTIRITHIPEIIAQIYSVAFKRQNITRGFRVTGIYPFNNFISTKSNFAPSITGDQPNPNLNMSANTENAIDEVSASGSITSEYISVDVLQSHRLASPCFETQKIRKTGKATILSVTPEMRFEDLEKNRKRQSVEKKSNKENKIPTKKKRIEELDECNTLTKHIHLRIIKTEKINENQKLQISNTVKRICIKKGIKEERIVIKKPKVTAELAVTAIKPEQKIKRKHIRNVKLLDYICE